MLLCSMPFLLRHKDQSNVPRFFSFSTTYIPRLPRESTDGPAFVCCVGGSAISDCNWLYLLVITGITLTLGWRVVRQ
jgi:hypothetical protein